MKAMKKVVIPKREVVREELDHIICDLCKKKFDDEDWDANAYDILETEVSMKTGHRWPGEGDSEETRFDICPGCFESVLIPFLKSKGAEPTIEKAMW